MTRHHGWAFPDADRLMAAEMTPDGRYQQAHLEAALRWVTHHGTAIDGGAHVGTWCRQLARRFRQVVAFEPASDTFACLVENMAAHGGQNVTCYEAALGAQPGRVRMMNDAKNEARGNTGARHVVAGEDVAVVTIDSLALDDVGFLKLDIEGSEPLALMGASATLTRCRPVVLVEDKALWMRHYGLPAGAVRDVLSGHRYRLAETVGCDQVWVPA